MAVWGLHYCIWAFSSCSKWELLSGCGTWSSHCAGFFCCKTQALGTQSQQLWLAGPRTRRLQWLQHASLSAVAPESHSMSSVLVAQGLSYSTADGILPHQGSNLCPLHWWAILIHCTTRELSYYPIFKMLFANNKQTKNKQTNKNTMLVSIH